MIGFVFAFPSVIVIGNFKYKNQILKRVGGDIMTIYDRSYSKYTYLDPVIIHPH